MVDTDVAYTAIILVERSGRYKYSTYQLWQYQPSVPISVLHACGAIDEAIDSKCHEGGTETYFVQVDATRAGGGGGVLICPSSADLDNMTPWRWVGACSTARQSIHRSASSGTPARSNRDAHQHQWLREGSNCQQPFPEWSKRDSITPSRQRCSNNAVSQAPGHTHSDSSSSSRL